MAKNKKNKNNQKKRNQLLKNTSAAELFEQGKALHNAGKQRDAIATLKMAAKKGWPRDQIDRLLFNAYSLRAVQLREKGMETEAVEVHKFACALMPAYQSLTEEELLLFVKAVDIQKAVGAYSDFLMANKPSGKIEQHLADVFFVNQQWNLLDVLGDQIPLKRDVLLVRDAVNLMNAGDWESALENLKPVPRSSPWATLRMFCHAMVCFYKEDDAGMQRAVNMIPDDSLLKPLSRKLANDIRAVSCLWDGPVHIESYIAALFDELRQNRLKSAGTYIKKIAETLSSQKTDIAIFQILELLWPLVPKGQMRENNYFKLVDKLLPQSLAKFLAAKVDCLTMSPMPFSNAAGYLSLFEIEFPEKKDRAIATAMVIVETIKNYQRSFSGGPFIDDNGIVLKKFLGLTSEDFEEFLPELLFCAISHDPGNHQAYELLVNLPSITRNSENQKVTNQKATNQKANKWIEDGLTVMQTHFPNDPYPCLELAKLYYSKNAYRKAENILKEAMIRAPHDIRVVNMHVMSLLISSDKNIMRDKRHLAREDINKAEGLGSPDTRFLVTEKQILLQIAEHGQLSLFGKAAVIDHGDVRRTIEEFTQRLTPFECLRSLGALFIDVNHSTKKATWDKKMIRVVDQAIRNRLKSINTLTQSELNSLLMPLSLELPVIPGNDMAALFVQRAKGLLGKVDDHHIIPVFDNLIGTQHLKPVLQEINRRRKKAEANFVEMLDFYDVTLKHLNGDLFNDEFAFLDVIDNVSVSDIEPIRAAARRLSVFAPDNTALKKALENFDFKYLDPDCFMDDGYYAGDEFDDDFDELFDDEVSAMNQKMILTLEKLIVDAGLTGAPKKAVLKFKQFILNGSVPLPLDMMTELMDNETIALMSRELRIILFGKA
ncbi:MAG: hypothetical protein J7K96_11710 [Desulfobacteraceae bacterium]|nr:hypothetical protein [Desulfobacteraceae bacterium]